MSQIINRPEYITYDTSRLKRGVWSQEDINKIEEEAALEQWEIPKVFKWNTGPWALHLKILAIPLLIIFISFVEAGLNYMTFGFILLTFSIFAPIYYISRSQYYHSAYKLTKSGILTDNLKVYPKFRYGRQDPTKFMNFMKVFAVLLVVLALIINPFYLLGAGVTFLLSFMKPWVDDGEKAYYKPYFWHDERVEDEFNISKVNICSDRKIIVLMADRTSHSCPLFCTEKNFDKVLSIVQERLPNIEYVKNEPIYD